MAENRVRIIVDLPTAQAVQGVAQIVDAMDGLGATVTRVGKEADAALTATTEKTKELARQGKTAADTIETAYQKLGMRSANTILKDIGEVADAYRTLQKSGTASAADLKAAWESSRSRLADLRAELSRVKDADGLKEQFRQAKQLAGEIGQLESLARTAGTAIASYLTFRELADVARDIVNVGMQFDALRNSLKAASNDSATAAEDFGFVRSEANRLGLELLSTGQAYAQLKNAAKGTALEGQGTEKIFSAVAEASRALHLSSDQTSGALLALQQMMSKGTVQAEELRGQLGERLPGAFNLAAQAMGVTTAELGKMLEQGQVLAVDLLPKLAEALHQAYGAGAAEAAQSAAAEMERLKNTVAEYKDMVYSAFSDDLAGAIRSTNSLLNENKESVNLYLLGIKGYAESAAAAIGAVGTSAKSTAAQLLEVAEVVARLVPGLSAFMVAKDGVVAGLSVLKDKGQETEQHKSNQVLLDEIEGIAKNGQKSILKSYSQDEYNKMMGLAPSYDSAKLLSGVPLSARSKLEKTWSDILPKIDLVNRDISSGNLQGSGLDKALAERTKLYEGLSIAQQDYQKSLDKGSKSEERAAIAAERYGERASAFLDQTLSALDQLQDSLTGGTEKNANRVDAWFEKQFDAIRKAIVGAKGDVSQYAAAWVALENAWPGDHILATTKDTIAALKSQAQILQDIAQATGDPGMLYAAEKKAAEAWYAEKKQLVENSIKDESEKSAALEALEEGYNAKLLDAKAKAYQDLAGVSSQYWDAESQLLDIHLKHVKENCDSEYAYEVYASKQRSDLRKKELESRIGYEQDFLSTLRDALSLEFGLYKDEATRQRDSWVSLSKDLASGVHDLSDTIAGGATDAFKSWITNSGSMADAFKSAMDSMLDYLMRMIQKMIAYALENYVVIPIVESVVGSTGSLTGTGTDSGSGSLSGSALSKITGKATDYGISKGIDAISGLFSGTTSAASGVYAAGSYGLGSSLIGESSSLLGAGAGGIWEAGSAASLAATPSVAATVPTAAAEAAAATSGAATGAASTGIGLGTALGVVGGVAALGGLLAMGLSTTKTEQKTGSGIRIAVIGDDTNVTGTDYYKVTTSSMLGGSSTSHEIRETGPADAETTAAVESGMGAYTSVIKSAFQKLGVSSAEESLSNFYFPTWDVAPGQEEDFYKNVSNAKVGKILADAGLTDAFSAIANEGEYWIEQITRLEAAMTTVGTATKQMGLSLESLAGEDYISGLVDKMLAAGDSAGSIGMDFEALAGVLDADTLASLKDMQEQAAATGEEVQATNEQLRQLALAQYASEIVEAFGSTDAAQAAFNRYFANAYSSTEQATRLMQYYAEGAGEAIGALDASGVSLENFWGSYRAAMESGPMSADQLKAWDDAAQWVEAWDGSLKNAAQAWDDTNQTVIDGINDQIKALESQRDAIQDTLDMWSDFLASIKDLRKEIKLDADLSDLSPKEIYEQKKALFDTTAAKARAGDEKAMAELPDVTKDFLEASRDYWASSEQYYQDFEHADETLASLEDYAQTQVDQAQAQLDAINNEISVLQLQVNQLALVNSNLGNLGNLMGDGVNAIVSAINNSTFSSSYVDAINAANAAQADAAASLLTSLGGSTGFSDSGSDTGFDWSGATGGLEVDEDGNWQWVGFSEGGLARGGVPGVDSIPAKLMDGERVIDVKHTKILEWLVEGGNTNRVDTSGIESRLDRVASTSAMASRANQVAIDGVRREMAGIRNKLSRDARRPKARTR